MSIPKIGLSMFEEYMQKQGMSVGEIAQMGLVFLSAKDASATLGYTVRECGVFIPYPGEDGFFRMRMLPGKGSKYLSRRESGTRLYLPANASAPWSDIKADVGKQVILTEGEFKSWRACAHGGICVGLGGVDAISPLWNSGFEWNRRTVYVCFDKDAGYVAGEYAPGVARALGRLCAELARRGATVWVLNIPGEKEQKLGLDDYLNAGGALDALVAGASRPPEWSSELGELLETCVYVVGTDSTHVFNLRNKSRKSVDDFHQAHVRKIMEGEDGKPKQLSRIWQRHRDRTEVQGYTLRPDGAYGSISDGLINLWTPYPTLPIASDAERRAQVRAVWERYVRGLFGETEVSFAGRTIPMWMWICLWTAHMLERPWEQTNQGVLVTTGVMGIGKSLYGEIIGMLVGRDHALECSGERMVDKFNPEMEGKTWVVVNELDAKFKMSVGQLNDLLSAEWMTIEHKGRNKYQLENYRRWYMTTNASSPCRLAPGQRRILVCYPPLVDGDTRGEWGQWVGSVVAGMKRDLGALGTLRDWFSDLWYESGLGEGWWNPTAPVPLTEEGEELAAASLTGHEVSAGVLWEDMLAHPVEVATGTVDGIESYTSCSVGAVHPAIKAQNMAVFRELMALCRRKGGCVSQKPVKEDGKVVTYTVYDCAATTARRERMASGSYRSTLHGDIIRAAAARMAVTLRNHLDGVQKF